MILHLLTGVKRLASDNTAVSGTPSLDNYITLVLHCFHSLLVILLKSQWLESRWQTDEWRGGSRQWSWALSMSDWRFRNALSFYQVTMELHRHTGSKLHFYMQVLPSNICPLAVCGLGRSECWIDYLSFFFLSIYLLFFYWLKSKYMKSLHNGWAPLH